MSPTVPIGLAGHLTLVPDPLRIGPRTEGSQLGGEAFVAALARHGSRPVEQFAFHGQLEGARHQVENVRACAPSDEVSTRPEWRVTPVDALPELLRHGGLGAFHTVEGPFLDLLADLRAAFSPRPIPLTGVTYGLGAAGRVNLSLSALLQGESLPCDAIVCISRSARDALARLLESLARCMPPSDTGEPRRFHGRLPVIPLGVDAHRFRPGDRPGCRRRLGLPPEGLLMLCQGRLTPVAKMDLIPLLLAFQRVTKQAQKPAQLVLAGADGMGYGSHVLAQAREMGLGPQVRLLGDVPPAALPDLYRACDLFVSVSDTVSESFGLTLVEAMASGLPVVASNWDGYRDIVEEGETGFLVPTRWADCDALYAAAIPFTDFQDFLYRQAQSVQVEVPALADRLTRLVQEPALRARLGEAGRKRAEAVFAWPHVVRAYEALWTEMDSLAAGVRCDRRLSPLGTLPPAADLRRHWATETLAPGALIGPGPQAAGLAVGSETPRLLSAMDGPLSQTHLAAIAGRLADGGCAEWQALLGWSASELALGGEGATLHLLWLLKHGYARFLGWRK